MPLDAVLTGKPEEAALVIVFLHGHDMRPEELAPFAPALGASVACHFVRGPCVTAAGANAWWLRDSAVTARRGEGPWDLHDEAPEGHLQARGMLGRYLRMLRLRHPGTPLLLAGFSQGGMVAMDTVLRRTCASTVSPFSRRAALPSAPGHRGCIGWPGCGCWSCTAARTRSSHSRLARRSAKRQVKAVPGCAGPPGRAATRCRCLHGENSGAWRRNCSRRSHSTADSLVRAPQGQGVRWLWSCRHATFA